MLVVRKCVVDRTWDVVRGTLVTRLYRTVNRTPLGQLSSNKSQIVIQ